MEQEDKVKLQIEKVVAKFADDYMGAKPKSIVADVHSRSVLVTLQGIIPPVERDYAKEGESRELVEKCYNSVFDAEIADGVFIGTGAIVQGVRLAPESLVPAGVSVICRGDVIRLVGKTGPEEHKFAERVTAANLELAKGYLDYNNAISFCNVTGCANGTSISSGEVIRHVQISGTI